MAITSSCVRKRTPRMEKSSQQCLMERLPLRRCVKPRMGLGSCQQTTPTPPSMEPMPKYLVASPQYYAVSKLACSWVNRDSAEWTTSPSKVFQNFGSDDRKNPP